MIRRWNTKDILLQLEHCAREAGDPYNDGFTAWSCKKDLWTVKYTLDELIKSLPDFVGEDEFLLELDKQLVWKALNEKNH